MQPGSPAPKGESYIAASYVKFVEVRSHLPDQARWLHYMAWKSAVYAQPGLRLLPVWERLPAAAACGKTTAEAPATSGRFMLEASHPHLQHTHPPTLADAASLPQSAGARAVPIVYDAPLEEITETVSKLNALLLPGGGAPITPGHRFYDTVSHLLNLTIQANDRGEHFAVRRTVAHQHVGLRSCVPVRMPVVVGSCTRCLCTTPAHALVHPIKTCWDIPCSVCKGQAGACGRYHVANTWTSRMRRACFMSPPALWVANLPVVRAAQLHGTCLGFEALAVAVSGGNRTLLARCVRVPVPARQA